MLLRLAAVVIRAPFQLADRMVIGGPRRDATLGDPDALLLVTNADAGAWQEVEGQLAQVRDPSDYSFLVGVLADMYSGDPSELDWWVNASPNAGIAHTVRGAAGVFRAWKSRGAGKAHVVTNRRWMRFFEELGSAQDDLFHAAERRQHDAEPVAWLIPCAMGLPFDDAPGELKSRYLGAMQRCPAHQRACQSMLTAMCQKWHGSHEKMFSVARNIVSQTKPGHPARIVILNAHYQRALYMELWENVERGAGEYFKRPEVAQEVAAISQEIEESAQIASLKGRAWHHSAAALCLWKAGLFSAASRHFEASNRYMPDDDWRYELFPRRTWRNARRECAKKGGSRDRIAPVSAY